MPNDFLSQLSADFGEMLSQPRPAAAPVTCTIERGLLVEDLHSYMDEAGELKHAQKGEEKDLAQLKEKHHSAARLLAEGVPHGVVAETCGYTPAYLSVLKNSPAMQNLISHYKQPGNLAAKIIGENLRRVGGKALERLEARIDDDELENFELLQAAKLGFDRSGHGPQQTVKQEHQHTVLVPEELLNLSRSARQRDADFIIPPEDIREILPPRKLEGGE